MLGALQNAMRLPDLRRKILFTLFILVIYRVAAHIPVPGVDLNALETVFNPANANATTGLLNVMDIFSGGALSNFSVVAMGVYPYITATIIMQLKHKVSATPADAPDFPGEPVVIDPNIQNRSVPTTGSTFLAFTPGFQMSLDGVISSAWTEMTSIYFYSQIPMVRDSNNSLAQGTSFIFGVTRSFQLPRSFQLLKGSS